MTLGYRNNNPGNLRPSGDAWQGMIGTEGGFMKFASMVWGVRAAIKNFKTWYGRGQTTLRMFITTYAPSSENDTENYINFISRNTKIDPDKKFTFDYETVKKILYYMFLLESQYQMPLNVFDDAWALATGEKKK